MSTASTSAVHADSDPVVYRRSPGSVPSLVGSKLRYYQPGFNAAGWTCGTWAVRYGSPYNACGPNAKYIMGSDSTPCSNCVVQCCAS